MFVLSKTGKPLKDCNQLMCNHDMRLMVWADEAAAQAYADSRAGHDARPWIVIPDKPEFYQWVGRKKCNRYRQDRPCYKLMGVEMGVKKTTSRSALVETFEDSASRRFAISSRADSEKEFLAETAQVLASGSSEWELRLKEFLPLIVDMACKYRGYKAESVLERRELVAGDLEMPKNE